jgi:hypothetical protein
MNKFVITLATLALGFSQISLAQTGYPNDITTPSQAPSQNPPPTSSPVAEQSSRTEDNTRYRSPGGLFVEPMLITSQEDTTIKSSQLPLLQDDTSGRQNGYGVGLRFGGHLSEIFMAGVDARYSKSQLKDSFYQTADTNVYDVAPFLGVQTPYFGVRLLAGYVLAGENDPASGVQGLDLKFKEANGWRVGAGVYIASVSLNVEYQDLTYNSTEIQNYGVINRSGGTSKVDASNRGYSLSLSFPVEL